MQLGMPKTAGSVAVGTGVETFYVSERRRSVMEMVMFIIRSASGTEHSIIEIWGYWHSAYHSE